MLTRSRNAIEDQGWALRKIEDNNNLESFDCENEDLNEFFRKDVLIQKQELLNETYELIEATAENEIPVALISLCNDAVRKEKIINLLGFTGTKKEYPFYPAVKVARLGVRKDLKDKDLGTHLMNMVKTLFVTNNRTGCRLITVDAYNKSNVTNFYIKNDFQFFSDKDKNKDQRAMFFDLKRLILS